MYVCSFLSINNVSLKAKFYFILIDLKTFFTFCDVSVQIHLCCFD